MSFIWLNRITPRFLLMLAAAAVSVSAGARQSLSESAAAKDQGHGIQLPEITKDAEIGTGNYAASINKTLHTNEVRHAI